VPADSAQTDVPDAAGQTEEPALHPLTEEAIAGAPMDGTATAAPVSPVSPGAGNPMTPPHMMPPPANPFDAAQAPPKKKMPTWAIVLIAAGVMLVLTVCCCLAMWAAFGDDFMEGFEEGLEAGMQQNELRLADPAPVFPLDDDNDDVDVDGDTDTDVSPAADGSAALIQAWIDDNRTELELMSEPLLGTMGEGASVDFQAADGEFIYIYTYGDFPSDGLIDILETILDISGGLYEEIATEFAREIGIDSMIVTVRYYQHGELLISESYQSR